MLWTSLEPMQRLGPTGLGSTEAFEALIRGESNLRYADLVNGVAPDDRVALERSILEEHLATVDTWIRMCAPFVSFHINLSPELVPMPALTAALQRLALWADIEVLEDFDADDSERLLLWCSNFDGIVPRLVLDDIHRQRGATVAMLGAIAARVKIDVNKTRELEQCRIYDRDVWVRELERLRTCFPRADIVVEGVEDGGLIDHLQRRVCVPTRTSLLLQGHAICLRPVEDRALLGVLAQTESPNGYRISTSAAKES